MPRIHPTTLSLVPFAGWPSLQQHIIRDCFGATASGELVAPGHYAERSEFFPFLSVDVKNKKVSHCF